MSKSYQEELNKYASCMEEIKLRVNTILLILDKKNSTGYKYTDVEFICLQFRKILELIALANLVSNKEEYSQKHSNFVNHYHAKHILRDIEKINPNFYPIPTIQIVDPKTKKVTQTVNLERGFLTKDEFLFVYDECAELLHAENPFSEKRNIDKYFKKFKDWIPKIINLLKHHQLQLIDINKQIWVVMNSGTDKKVRAFLFEKIGKVGEVDLE